MGELWANMGKIWTNLGELWINKGEYMLTRRVHSSNLLCPAFPGHTQDPGFGLGRPDQNTPKSGRKQVLGYAIGPIFGVWTKIRRPDRPPG